MSSQMSSSLRKKGKQRCGNRRLPVTARTNDHQLDIFKQQKCVLSWSWRLEIRNRFRFVGRALLSLRTPGQNPSLSLPCPGSLPAILGGPWLVSASLPSLPQFLHDLLSVSPNTLFLRTQVIGFGDHPNPVLSHFN